MIKLKEKVAPDDFRRGEVWRVNLDDGSIGHEQRKKRRVLIVQNNTANKYSSLVTVVAITTDKGKKRYPDQVLLSYPEGGTTQDSIIQTSQIRTLDKEERFIEYCGQVTDETMAKVDTALALHLGLKLEDEG